jgi:hypothetical protein
MHPLSFTRDIGSTRGFATTDPERQGVLVSARRPRQGTTRLFSVSSQGAVGMRDEPRRAQTPTGQPAGKR